MDTKDAQIVSPLDHSSTIPDDFLQENAKDESRLVAFASKLDSLIASSADIHGVLVNIRQDLKNFPQPINQVTKEASFSSIATRHLEKISNEFSSKGKEKTVATEKVISPLPSVASTDPKLKPPAPTPKPAADAKAIDTAKHVDTVKQADTAKPKPQKESTTVQKTDSQRVMESRHNETERSKDRKSILGGIKDAIVNVGAAGVGAASNTIEDQDTTDIIGTAVGGPIWGAVKELKDVADNTDFGKIRDIKDKLTGRGKILPTIVEPPETKRDKNGKLRDSKGHFISSGGTKAKVRERKNAQNIEAERIATERLAEIGVQTLASQTDNERNDETRHKELIKVIENSSNSGSMLRNMLDRRRPRRKSKRGSRNKPDIKPGKDASTKNKRSGKPTVKDSKSKVVGKPETRSAKAKVVGTPDRKAIKSGPKMVERKRPYGAMGKIKVPEENLPAKRSRKRTRGGKSGKFGKLATLVGGLGVGGGLLSGFFGGGDSPVQDMVVEEGLSTALEKSSEIVSKPAKVATKAGGKGATKLSGKTASKLGGKGLSKLGGKTASKLGTKTVAKLGMKAAGGALRAIPVIGQIAALGMAGYDAFEGYNDKEMQAKAFDLKDGQEATTGQKTSTALANVLDMGGLGTGLLGMLGVDTDTADIAKGIHGAGSWLSEAVGLSEPKAGKDGEKGEKDIVQKALAPVASIVGGAKSLWSWVTGGDDKKADVAAKTAKPTEPRNPVTSDSAKRVDTSIRERVAERLRPKVKDVNPGQPQVVPQTKPVIIQQTRSDPISRIEHVKPLPQIDRIKNAPGQTEKVKPTATAENAALNRIIKALEKNVKNPLSQVRNQQPVAPKSNIKIDFEDSMLTLMAYDRI